MQNITIDNEFKNLIAPLTHDEYKLLQDSIIDDGCRDALIVWKRERILVDGHHRYKICTERDIDFNIEEYDFDDRTDVKKWMYDNQLGRRNLTDEYRTYLLGARYKLEKQPHGGDRKSSHHNDDLKTAERLAAEQGTSKATVERAEKYHDAVDAISEHSDEIKDSILRGETAFTKKGTVQLAAVLRDDPEIGEKAIDEVLAGNAKTPEQGIAIARKEQRKTELAVEVLDLDIDEVSLQLGIHNCDMVDLYDMIEDNTVDMFLTDPPYPKEYLYLYEELARLAADKLVPGGFCLAYSGQTHLPQVMSLMSKHLDYWWCFAISHTGGSQQIFHRDVLCGWKPVLVFTKKDESKTPKPISWVKDFVTGGGRDKQYHEWGQDATEVIPWIEAFTIEGQLICDPFVGGGSTPMACKLTNRNFIGTEIELDHFNESIVRMKEYDSE